MTRSNRLHGPRRPQSSEVGVQAAAFLREALARTSEARKRSICAFRSCGDGSILPQIILQFGESEFALALAPRFLVATESLMFVGR